MPRPALIGPSMRAELLTSRTTTLTQGALSIRATLACHGCGYSLVRVPEPFTLIRLAKGGS